MTHRDADPHGPCPTCGSTAPGPDGPGRLGSVPLPSLITDIQAGNGFTTTDTGFAVGAASASYCPQHLQWITSGR